MSRTIAIVGAGLGGLTAALALIRKGWTVRVFEQASTIEEVGAGISLSSGAGGGLASLGLGPALLAASLPIPDIAFVHYRTGALLAGVLDRGAPEDHGFTRSRHIHRADLQAILLKGVVDADPNAVRTGCRVDSVDQDADGVTLHFAGGASFRADLLVAADGARSVVRRQFFDDREPEFAGQVAFRCLIPRAEAEPYMKMGNAVVSIGAARTFNRYLIRHGELVNVVAIGKSDRWRQEGWNTPASIAEFLEEYGDFHPDVTGLIRRAPQDHLIKWGLFTRPPIAEWSLGRILLVGDAAHPILPFLGLGAALAMEDGIVLARAMEATPDPAKAFAAYQAARYDRVEDVRVRTIRQGEVIQATDPDRQDMNQSPSQDRRIFDYDPCTIPIVV